MTLLSKIGRLSFIAAIGIPAAMGGMSSYTGTFSSDDQVETFDFTLASDSTVTFQSYGYGGGTNAAGTVISAGGFDSYLTWYGPDGNTMIGADDDSCGSATPDVDGCLDAYFSGPLSAGSYTLALTEYYNLPNGDLSDGFSQQGTGDFTATGSCPEFCDFEGTQRTGNWAVDILTEDSSSATPEPSSYALTGCGLALLALAGRRSTPSRTNSKSNLRRHL